ncbi:MAG: hypothetical protein IH630_03400 [Thermoplasmata archaeon]|nr:hypothetical protein [Thermoplasmata archaeon]TFG71069.1 MAG: hypothetical protein E4H25_00035 [Methanomassiliicoccus sp.]
MRVGDLDGKNSIYEVRAVQDYSGFVVNFSGHLIPESGEKILFFETESLLNIHKCGSINNHFYPSFGGESVEFYPEAGWGTLYLTDRRIIFLRKPEANQLYESYKSSSNMYSPETVPDRVYMRAIRIHRFGGMEFLEIRYEDIIRFEEGKYTSTMFLQGGIDTEYEMTLDRHCFERVRPILAGKFIEGRRRPLMRHLSALALITLNMVALIGVIILDDLLRIIPLIVIIFSFAILAISYIFGPEIKNVKKNKWGQDRASFVGTVVAFAVGMVFVALGIAALIISGSAMVLIVTLLFSGFMFILSAIALKEYKFHRVNRLFVSYMYKCPACGTLVSRREIGCGQCGAVVWWLQFPKFRIRYVGREPKRKEWTVLGETGQGHSSRFIHGSAR